MVEDQGIAWKKEAGWVYGFNQNIHFHVAAIQPAPS
jgi:hypothetical protein